MVTLQIMDNIFYEAQRQGRISFYLTTIGEEAINIASAAALDDNDIIFSQVHPICNIHARKRETMLVVLSNNSSNSLSIQYREPGVLMWRGFTLQEFANQCFGNEADLGKGRQMPIHYGSNALNFLTVSSTIA